MKLLFAIIQNEDEKRLTGALVDHDISVTRVSSSGGFLHSGNTTLMIGVESDKLQVVLDIIKAQSRRRKSLMPATAFTALSGDSASMPIEVNIGGATVFVLDIEQFCKY